ncbi:hypothetical protein CEXT_503301 [Caerostris extrusa]|uniref:C2H2-type domain-containing protein n=1 Tax=Caerostris extrusa TaxID=172846 RepID=A0AAV4P1C7_CAEEX|nr:hypothetical protein CEXT_503301 [Caerostris extrusa]
MSALLLWKPGNCRKGCGTADDKKLVKHVGSHRKTSSLPFSLHVLCRKESNQERVPHGNWRNLTNWTSASSPTEAPTPPTLVGNKVGDGESKWGCKYRLIDIACMYHVKMKVYSRL